MSCLEFKMVRLELSRNSFEPHLFACLVSICFVNHLITFFFFFAVVKKLMKSLWRELLWRVSQDYLDGDELLPGWSSGPETWNFLTKKRLYNDRNVSQFLCRKVWVRPFFFMCYVKPVIKDTLKLVGKV